MAAARSQGETNISLFFLNKCSFTVMHNIVRQYFV